MANAKRIRAGGGEEGKAEGRRRGNVTNKQRGTVNKQRFLKAYMICGTLTGASAATGISLTSHKNWHAVDDEYRQAYADAKEAVADMLEGEAIRRATQGTNKMVLYKGKPVKVNGKILYETTFSDTLLIFLLKGKRPDVFRDKLDIGLENEQLDKEITAELEKLASNSEKAAAEQASGKKRRVGKKSS